ncbi:LysR family transcriptional regulator [Variovorax sp. H27-G14]|uniref:LysR family transcriptional regulator n=1 Tax=Variovorax sp. H27-G14 TaxID=3111914 RepID=UPI0038FCEC18
MDRIDAMKVFVAALDEGSLAGAGRKLGKSPAAVSRAIAFLEAHVGAELLHRTTRSIRLSDAGERYVVACRRILTDLEEADIAAAGERSAPRGRLTVTAAVAVGESLLRPILDEFMNAHPTVSVRLHLLDRPANLIDEGIDVALRIAHLPDSTLVALPVGEVRRVVTASPRYLARHPRIVQPADIAQHQVVAMTHFGIDSWSFPPEVGSGASAMPRTVQFTPRFVVNSLRAAIASAVDGRGVLRSFSYHVADEVADGRLRIILASDEAAPLPAHLVSPHGRLSVPKVRAFVDFALPRLHAGFAAWSEACAPKAKGSAKTKSVAKTVAKPKPKPKASRR